MENSKPEKKQEEEIDLGDLFRYIKNGFNTLGTYILLFINFLLKNIVLLLVLLVVGVAIGYYLESTTKKTYKTEAIVTTDFGSAEYLYGGIEEINFKLKKQDQDFIDQLGISNFEAYNKLVVKVYPVVSLNKTTNEEQNFYELLKESNLLTQEEQKNAIAKNFESHKISLYHPEDSPSQEILTSIIEYLRDNDYYQQFYKDYLEAIDTRIANNKVMIREIDKLVNSYTKSLDNTSGSSQQLQYYNVDNSLDLGEVLNNRLNLQRDNTNLIEDRSKYTEFLTIVKVGSTKELEESALRSNNIIFIPFMLIVLFFAFILLQIVFKKARALKN